MNKIEIKKKWELIKEKKSEILGVSAFLVAFSFMVWIGSLGFYW